MKSCPQCKHIVTFYYDKYRCSYCSIWLDPDEVLSNSSDNSPVSGNVDSTLTEVQRRMTNNPTADKPSKQTLVGQNSLNS